MKPEVGKKPQKYSAPAAAAAAEMLLILARDPEPLSIAQIAARTGRTKSLVYRVLAELESRSFVTRGQAGSYSLGVAAVELGGAFSTSVPLLSSIRQVLRQLSAFTNETANLGILQGDQVLYLAREEGELSVISVSRVGKLLPANATAIGKALLAELSDDDVRQLFATRLTADGELGQLTPRSLTSIDDLLWDLHKTRSRGYAEEGGETVVGRCCLGIAVPFGERGVSHAAISVSMAEHRFHQMRHEVLDQLLKVKEQLTNEGRARAAIG